MASPTLLRAVRTMPKPMGASSEAMTSAQTQIEKAFAGIIISQSHSTTCSLQPSPTCQ